MARGNYYHDMFRGADQAEGLKTGELSPGNRPDAWNGQEIREYKPYHEEINPLTEYGDVIGRYSRAYRTEYGYCRPTLDCSCMM